MEVLAVNKNDLRYQKTEQRLKKAYLTLLKTKRHCNFTVKEICAQANCSRNTFYLHYETRIDLGKAIYQEIIDKIENAFTPRTTDLTDDSEELLKSYTDGIINEIIPFLDTLAIFCYLDDGVFFYHLMQTIYNKCSQVFPKNITDRKQAILELNTHYLAAAITGFIFSWTTKYATLDISIIKSQLYLLHRQTIRQSLSDLA